MDTIIERLQEAGAQHKGTDLGGLLQWAALHVAGQDEAMAELRKDLETEERERLRLESALNVAKEAAESALAAITAGMFEPVELSRDYTGHINIMAGHGDPDYMLKDGRSVRHVDLREKAPRKNKAANTKVQPSSEVASAATRC